MRTPFLLAVALTAGLCGAATAQTTPASPAATPGAPAGAHASPAKGVRKGRKASPPSTAMDVTGASSGVTPTGPNTTTDDAPAVSDLTGSTGASSVMTAAPAPPGVAPPGGAPDTRGAETPNTDGGPH